MRLVIDLNYGTELGELRKFVALTEGLDASTPIFWRDPDNEEGTILTAAFEG